MALAFGVALGVLSMLGYAISDYFATLASKKAGWFETATVSRGISFVALTILLFLFFRIPRISLGDLALLLIAGLLATIALQLFYKALSRGALSVVAPISDSSVAITVLLLLLFFGMPLNGYGGFAILIIIIGTILSSLEYKKLEKLKPKRFTRGVGLAALSALAFGVDVFLEIILVKHLGWFIPAVFIYFVMLVYNLIYSKLFGIKVTKAGKELIPAAFAGLAAASAFLIFNYGVALDYSIVVTPIAGAATAMTILLGFVFLGEKLENNQKLGVALIAFGIILLSVV